jgi:septum site-determining protein MinD
MLAVCGGKGGVGKTTTAVGLGAALGAQHRRALVVDADTDMPDLHVVSGTPAEPGVDALAAGAPLQRVTHPTRWRGLSAVPATPGAAVTEALARLPTDRPVLVDCPGGGGPRAATALRAADRALVVTTPATPAIRDAKKTAAMARSLDAPPVGVVVNRGADAGVGEHFDHPVLTSIPETDTPLADCASQPSYRRLASTLGG